ncbi:hypothetical protein [Pseudomonas phage vB_Pae_SG_WM_SEW_P16]
MAKVVRVDELKTGDEILIKLRADAAEGAARNKAIVLSVECWRDEITLELTCPAGDYWEDWRGKYRTYDKVVLLKRD